MNKKRISLVLYILIAVAAVASIVCYLIFPPWKALFLACCGGVIIVNLLFSLFLVRKNMK